MNLSFLNNVTVAAVQIAPKAAARTKKQYQPENADLRIWNTGAIYPSAALVEEFGLEYQAKDAENKGFGFDIIDVREMPAITTDQPFIAISCTSRTEGKVDVFASTTYNEDGSPKSTVSEQGAATYGKESFLPLLKDVYGIEPNEEGYIDLVIHRAMPFNSPNGIYRFPKTVSRGAQKGEISYIRRENQVVYALVPSAAIETEEVGEVATTEDETPETVLEHTAAEVSAVVSEGPFAEDVAEEDPFVTK